MTSTSTAWNTARDAYTIALQATTLPRTVSGPSDLRRWALAPQREHAILTPAPIERFFSLHWASLLKTGNRPDAHLAAQILTVAHTAKEQDHLLAHVAAAAIDRTLNPEENHELLTRSLLRGERRPEDLTSLIHGALALHYTAYHAQPGPAVGELLAMVATCWWTAGQTPRSIRINDLAAQYNPTSDRQRTLATAHRLGRRPAWL